MKKFTNLGSTNKTVDLSDNRQDFIKNLIDESLTLENGEIKGKDILSAAINKMFDITESKTKITVLENVKVLTARGLNIQLINESIELEKKNIENIKSENITKKEELVEMVVEKKCDDKKCECEDEKCECEDEKDAKKRGEGEEEDGKIDDKNKKDEKPEETEVVESMKMVYVIDGSDSKSEIDDLAKLVESIKSIDEEEKKKLD